MFNLSGSEIVVILLLALIVLGPDKLPEAMRKAGKTWAELRKLSSGFQEEVRKGFDEPTTEVRQTANAIKKAATLPKNPVKGAVKSLLEPPAAAGKRSGTPAVETAPIEATVTESEALDAPEPEPIAVTEPEALDVPEPEPIAVTEPAALDDEDLEAFTPADDAGTTDAGTTDAGTADAGTTDTTGPDTTDTGPAPDADDDRADTTS